MNNTAIRSLWLAAIFALFSSCGIPTIQVLAAPEVVSWTVAPPTVTFSHNVIANSTENFIGYELYYKFYQHTPNPSEGEFGDDLSILGGAVPSSGTAAVTGQGFRRIWKAGDTVANLPLISIQLTEPPTDPATAFEVDIAFPDRVSILFPDPAEAAFLDRTDENSTKLVRDPDVAPGASGKTFESDDIAIDPNDLDIPAGIPPTDDRIHMAVVILAYGIDYTGGTFQPIYSDPLMAGQPLEIILQ